MTSRSGSTSAGSVDRALVEAVRAGLRDLADPDRAPAMQRYMKSELPYHGVKMPEVRRLTRSVYAEHVLSHRDSWTATVRALYDEAAFREERYAALMLLSSRRYRDWLTADTLPLVEHLVVTGAWWDLVDDLAHDVGAILLVDRARAEPVVRGWIDSPDLWLRRAAILCQLGLKDRTDVGLLADAITPAMGEREFFLRKGIGWALREYARTDPEWVRRFVAAHETELSPLSRREALKHLDPP